MRGNNTKSRPPNLVPYCWGANIPMRLIRRFVRQVAERFRPDRIILFGSYAYGTPNENSDVDILVVMPARNQLDQAIKIGRAIPPPFSMDLIVRTPAEMKWRLEEKESFLTEIISRGKVLYEKDNGGMGKQGGRRLPRRHPTRRRQTSAV
jgi:predicted nucleotidyltransferase